MDPIAIAVGLLLVGAMALAATSAWSVSARNRAALEQRLTGSGEAPAAPAEPRRPAAILARLLSPLAALSRPKRPDDTGRLSSQLARAGFRGPHAASIFLGSRMAGALSGLGIFVAVAANRAEPIPAGPSLGVILFAAGYYLPAWWLSRRTARRQAEIERGLPDAIDLLVTCVEAGLGLDAAMQRVADEVGLAYPVLSQELQLNFLEVNAGIPRVEAFRRLAERTGVVELKSLAATLNQTEIFGTSVAGALRVQADGMRIRRMQRAEERAATVSVKLTIPLVLFILPSLFAVVLGPAVVNVAKALLPTLGGRR
ncbi:MAG TPA: type II secretion system F family protein [Anaeromyxobacteraceae bacterium]|nr:type II secretion system F family protein [Anaeromyxobacteraceae bacterium]